MAKELYVGHLSGSVTEEDIRKLFSVVGTVTSVHLIIDPETKEFKRCGYVRMAADVDPNEVVETLDGALLIDQVITVSIARPQKPGMSKSGKPGQFGGPKRFGPKAGAASKISAGPRGHAESKTRPERTSESRPKPRGEVKAATGPKFGAEPTTRTEQKGGRGQKPAGRPARETGRTTAPKPRRP
jgi:RNA recognition motif-containing protein